jgi:glycosyltransferase involved in cell wall biosynthesis
MLTLIESKKIAYMTNMDISLDNGPGVNEREFVTSLARKLPANAYFLIPKPLKQGFRLNGNFKFCRNPRRGFSYNYVLNIVSQCYHGIKLLRQHHFDIIVFRLGLFPIACLIITLIFNRNVAIKTLGNYDGAGRLNDTFIKKLLYRLNSIITRQIVSRASAIDACTPQFIERHKSVFGNSQKRYELIENVTNTKTFHPMERNHVRELLGLSGYDPIVGFVGGRPDEESWPLIEGSVKLTQRFPKCGIVFVGGRGINRLKERAEVLGTHERCVFAGQVEYDRVTQYINAFDVCVSLTSMRKMAVIGNSSQKIRQYIACGKPVIASRGGNHFIEKYGLGILVNSDDVEQVCLAIAHYFNLNINQREEISKKLRSYAEKNLCVETALKKRLCFWQEVFFA